jgi:MoaA/NifB/PqqE/SkfB family radical SAM enzyme
MTTSFKNLSDKIKENLAVLNYKLLKENTKIPRVLFLSLTYRCQLNCLHCRYAQNSTNKSPLKDISLNLAYNILKQAADSEIPRIILFGGEPTLHPHIEKIAKKAASLGLFVELDTNGLKLDKKFIERLKKAGVSAIRISLHSHLPSEHNKAENLKSFDKIKKATEMSLKAGLLVYLSSCQYEKNLNNNDIENLIKLSKNWGVHGIRVLGYISNNDSENNISLKLFNKLENLKTDNFAQTCFSLFKDKAINTPSSLCVAQKKYFFFIDPSGETKTCPYATKILGNILEKPLSALIKKNNTQKSNKLPCLSIEKKL